MDPRYVGGWRPFQPTMLAQAEAVAMRLVEIVCAQDATIKLFSTDIFRLWSGTCGHTWVKAHDQNCPVCEERATLHKLNLVRTELTEVEYRAGQYREDVDQAIEALIDPEAVDRVGTHWEDCYKAHPVCMALLCQAIVRGEV